jgi:hypothetical protein
MIGWIIDQFVNYYNTPEVFRTPAQETMITVLTLLLIGALISATLVGYGIYQKISSMRNQYEKKKILKKYDVIEDDTEAWLNRHHEN